MSRPSLPNYQDSENENFHPVFKKAAEEAISAKGLTDEICIKSQFPSPTGPIDLVLFSNKSRKVILPIEIKRTQSSARGAGRRQARDYWSNLGVMCETKFYCVSNLEIIELFRFDKDKPKTLSQKIKLDNANVGLLIDTDENLFYEKLIDAIVEILDVVLGNKKFIYNSGLSQFQIIMETSVDDPQKWHKNFIPASFEYIRGASKYSENLKSKTELWKEAAFYSNNPERLNTLGGKINFNHVFTPPIPLIPNDSIAFKQQVLSEAFECGRLYGAGDDIAELVNDILAPRGLGIVETDMELAQLISIFGKVSLGRALQSDELVLDPASGSGRLLTALPVLAFPSIQPYQLWANEIEKQFSESLSLRLGLAFSQIISNKNSSKITISPIESFSREDFSKIALVVMNPPFVSGVQSSIRKIPFIKKIEELTGNNSLLNHGQVALEILFLELMWSLVKDDVSIVTVFPAQHLYRISKEAQAFRDFLINKFSLSYIVLYPSKGLFSNVIKQTVLLIGRKNIAHDHVKVVEIQRQVSDIDLNELMTGLEMNSEDHMPGIHIHKIPKENLLDSNETGWRNLVGGKRAGTFINDYMSSLSVVSDLPKKYVRRGTIGNGGNTKLTVFHTQKPNFPEQLTIIPKDWLMPVLNTTENMPRILTLNNAPQMSFLPPIEAYLEGTAENLQLQNIVRAYMEMPIVTKGKQAKRKHNFEEIVTKLQRDQKDFGGGWVLIQRASRVKGDVSVLEDDGVLLSTNVPMIKLNTKEERRLFASWMLSIFGQLQLEYYSTPQEGMRKLEMGSISKLKYPNFSNIESQIKNRLLKLFDDMPAKEFLNPKLNESDYLWAKIIHPSNPDECLEIALDIFSELIDERRGFGGK
ncbi:TPA: BpuSI family type II restriction endonuclease [Enterobacter roggenkampii]